MVYLTYDFTSRLWMKFKKPQAHFQEVEKLQQTLTQKKGRFSLKQNRSSNTLRNGDYKKKSHSLDLSPFNQILEFDPQTGSILVEPRITFGTLCRFTLKHGLLPPVVPEFPSITVGGAITGAAIESTSHRYGQVSDHCLSYELLLGNGDKITASPEEHSDLFYAISGSYGTLALLTAVRLRLIPAKPFVQLHTHWFNHPEEAVKKLTLPSSTDGIEGIVFSPSEAVVVEATLTDSLQSPIYKQSFPWSRWFAQHLQQDRPHQETIPTLQYLFRHDRGAFWIGRYILSFQTLLQSIFHWGIPEIEPSPLNPSLLLRLLFGWYFPSHRLYHLWHRIPNTVSENLFFIHDFYTPFPHAHQALQRWMELTQIFPIWLCPIKGSQTQFLSPHYGHSHFLNIGLYGRPPPTTSIPYLSAQLEKDLLHFGGRKMLYSFVYYDEPTFNTIYPIDLYTQLRHKYSAHAFPTLFQKVSSRK